jgi:hypothetical protein
MKAVTIAAFGLGYVFGTKAGRERYAQILEIAEGVTAAGDVRQRRRAIVHW